MIGCRAWRVAVAPPFSSSQEAVCLGQTLCLTAVPADTLLPGTLADLELALSRAVALSFCRWLFPQPHAPR